MPKRWSVSRTPSPSSEVRWCGSAFRRSLTAKLARKIVDCAPLSVKAAKASVLAAMDLGCEKRLIDAGRLHVEAYASLDAIEGPRGFAEKRKPAWKAGRS